MEDAVDAVLRVLASDARIQVAWIFGSFARGEARPTSDVDVAVLASPPLSAGDELRLGEALMAAARRRVDLVMADRAPPLLGRELVTEGRVILCRDDGARAEYLGRAMVRYHDTRHLREVQTRYLRERVARRP